MTQQQLRTSPVASTLMSMTTRCLEFQSLVKRSLRVNCSGDWSTFILFASRYFKVAKRVQEKSFAHQ